MAYAIKDCIKMGLCSPGDTIVSVYHCVCCGIYPSLKCRVMMQIILLLLLCSHDV